MVFTEMGVWVLDAIVCWKLAHNPEQAEQIVWMLFVLSEQNVFIFLVGSD